jgi:hypothetical protein
MNVFQDLKDDRGPRFASGTIEQVTQAVSALGLLFYSRAFGHMVSVNGIDFRDASHTIIAHFQVIVEHRLESRIDEELDESQNA